MKTNRFRRIFTARGFGLVELAILLIVFAIGVSVALRSMTGVLKSVKKTETEREMEAISNAIVGNPDVTTDGIRSSFGFVGDCGVFPTSLNALRTNSDNIPTWNGPYVVIPFTQDTTSWKTDGWGSAYALTGGNTISSTGSGATISKVIVDSVDDYIRNSVTGVVSDNAGSEPGTKYKDSVRICITIPNGVGGNITKTYSCNSTGTFTVDSIPAGRRIFRAILLSRNDTVRQLFTVLPNHQATTELAIKFGTSYFTDSIPSSTLMVLRPTGAGTNTNLTKHGGTANWDAVDEVKADNGTTYVSKSGAAASDSYQLQDPSPTTGTIVSVSVRFRVKSSNKYSGPATPGVYVSSTWYYGTTINTARSYFDYIERWTVNPSTGVAWTWTDVTNLQPGIKLAGSGGSRRTYCTQLFVVVEYQ